MAHRRAVRRFRILRPGGLLIGGTIALGIATLNTGNNLLYLLLGSLLGLIALSSILSERTLSATVVRRVKVAPMTAGQPGRITYRLTHRGRGLPAFALEVREEGWDGVGFVVALDRGDSETVVSVAPAARRGIHAIGPAYISTAFPFGLFRKERRAAERFQLIVRPRTDGEVRAPRPAPGEHGPGVPATSRAPARRGTFRSLREWRAGDDPRDVHWRSSARRPAPVVREYEPEAGGVPWIVLDTRGPADRAEAAIEIAAALAARMTADGRMWGFAAATRTLEPDSGIGQLEAALDLMAALAASPHAPSTPVPAGTQRCILVAPEPPAAGDWLDSYAP